MHNTPTLLQIGKSTNLSSDQPPFSPFPMLPKTKMGRTVIEKSSPSTSESVIDLRLPQDLITEILLYLPVKSLVKFKCVSKPWLYLISSPQFIKSHFATSSREGQYSNHQLLVTTQAPNSGMTHCSLSAALHNPSTNVSDIEYPSRNPKVSLRIVGIVNGLVCLAIGENDLYLWNPILRKSKHLPSSNFSVNVCGYVSYGFGYNESNDDYKVVIVPCVYSCGGDYETNCNVYSLWTDTWRRIEGFKGEEVHFCNGTYASGKIWWTATTRISASGGNWKIFSLDMVSDKYEELQGPGYEAGACYCGIGSFDGCLSMLCDYYRTKADLWVMDNNGVEKSWSKVFSLPYVDVQPPAVSYFLKKVVWILEDSEIVLEDRSGLIVYPTKTRDLRNIQLDGLGLYRVFSVYVESLVPL